MSDHSNTINRVYNRLRNLESLVDELLLESNKPIYLQLFNQNSVSLSSVSENTYTTVNNQQLFNVNVNTENHYALNINVSASFIITASAMDEGSIVMKLKINNTLVTENETYLLLDGYAHLTLNYVQEIEKDSVYNIEVLYEGLVVSPVELTTNPILSVKNNGGSLSIIVI